MSTVEGAFIRLIRALTTAQMKVRPLGLRVRSKGVRE